MKNCFIFFCFLISIFSVIFCVSCASGKVQPDITFVPESEVPAKKQDVIITQKISEIPSVVDEENPIPFFFAEIWAYVIDGRESELSSAKNCVTDIGYFGASLSTFGNLCDVPNRKKINLPGAKVHLVVVDNGKALTHFCISSDYSVRHKLIDDIVKAAAPFDGVQIDFELVSSADKDDYFSFLQELKRRMPRKTLSIAVPARTRTLRDDAYNYKELSKIVDRIVVMAYDEHWSTSIPGPVASIDWCRNIMQYSQTVIPSEKLIMGLPLYGRCWNTDDTAGAYKFTSVERVQGEQNITEIKRINDIPSFTVTKEVVYQFYYDDLYSLTKRLGIYADNGVQNVSFWRLGQEDVNIWQYLITGDLK